MHSIEDKINELLKKQGEHSKIQENTKNELSLIRERIRAEEESTGDVVRDFILAYYLEQREIEESIRFLEKDISNNQGKQVLIVKEEGIWHPPVYEPYMYYFQSPQGHMSKNEEENLGILEGNLNLNVREGNILIPTQKYVARGHTLMNITTPRKEGAQEGPIKINVTEFIYLNTGIPDVPCSARGIVSTRSDIFHSLRILIGDELVESYYKLPSFFEKSFWELIERKQKGEDVQLELKKLQEEKIDPFYLEALIQLEKPIPDSLKKQYAQKIKREQKKINYSELVEPILKKERAISLDNLANQLNVSKDVARGIILGQSDEYLIKNNDIVLLDGVGTKRCVVCLDKINDSKESIRESKKYVNMSIPEGMLNGKNIDQSLEQGIKGHRKCYGSLDLFFRLGSEAIAVDLICYTCRSWYGERLTEDGDVEENCNNSIVGYKDGGKKGVIGNRPICNFYSPNSDMQNEIPDLKKAKKLLEKLQQEIESRTSAGYKKLIEILEKSHLIE